MGSRSHCLLVLVTACKSLAISLIDGGNDDKTLGVISRLEWDGIGEGLDEILRLETLSEQNEAKGSARDGLGIMDGMWGGVCVCDVVKSLLFQRRRRLGIDDWGWGPHWIVIQHVLSVYDIGLLLCEEFYNMQKSGKRCICIQNDG